MAKSKSTPESVLELPVTFGGLSVGDRTCRLGVSVSRGNYTVAKADKQLCERRLKVSLLARSNGAHADQNPLPGLEDSDVTVEGTCDVRGFSAGGKAISFGVTFMISGVDLESLTKFPKRDGRITVHEVTEIPEGETHGESDEA